MESQRESNGNGSAFRSVLGKDYDRYRKLFTNFQEGITEAKGDIYCEALLEKIDSVEARELFGFFSEVSLVYPKGNRGKPLKAIKRRRKELGLKPLGEVDAHKLNLFYGLKREFDEFYAGNYACRD